MDFKLSDSESVGQRPLKWSSFPTATMYCIVRNPMPGYIDQKNESAASVRTGPLVGIFNLSSSKYHGIPFGKEEVAHIMLGTIGNARLMLERWIGLSIQCLTSSIVTLLPLT